ncbi:MAG: hypothetical protein AAB664_02340 [Patescibacteria group bacterium]
MNTRKTRLEHSIEDSYEPHDITHQNSDEWKKMKEMITSALWLKEEVKGWYFNGQNHFYGAELELITPDMRRMVLGRTDRYQYPSDYSGANDRRKPIFLSTNLYMRPHHSTDDPRSFLLDESNQARAILARIGNALEA